MPVQKFLSNTLHGEARPYITQCSLAAATARHRAKFEKESKRGGAGKEQAKGRGDGKPEWLPLPTEVPLRYCKHKDAEGNEAGELEEAECLVDLVGGQPKGNETRKNKNHYVIATAESEEEIQRQQQLQSQPQNPRKRKRGSGTDVREVARQIPGVPIVYVKRSVMILEELSAASERLIRGVEREKFKEGLIGDARGVKRKRPEEGDDGEDGESGRKQINPKVRGLKKAKNPNPLSVKKKKTRPEQVNIQTGAAAKDVQEEEHKKRTRKRRHGKHVLGGQEIEAQNAAISASVSAQESGVSLAAET